MARLLQKLKRSDEALNHYRDAQTLARAMLKDQSDDREASRLLSAALINEADTLARNEKSNDGRSLIEESVEIRKRLADAAPHDPTLRRDLSTGEIRLGRCLENSEKYDEALAHYRTGLAIREKLLTENANATAKRDVALAHENIGRVQMALGKSSEADRELRLALAGVQELSKSDNADQRVNADDVPRIRRTLNKLNHSEAE